MFVYITELAMNEMVNDRLNAGIPFRNSFCLLSLSLSSSLLYSKLLFLGCLLGRFFIILISYARLAEKWALLLLPLRPLLETSEAGPPVSFDAYMQRSD